jgi:hypothetical protein
MDDEKFQKIIKTKCNLCFRRDLEENSCMLYSSKHSGVELCLGPFKDQEDRLKKKREDDEKEKKQADMDRVRWEVMINDFERKKKPYDD